MVRIFFEGISYKSEFIHGQPDAFFGAGHQERIEVPAVQSEHLPDPERPQGLGQHHAAGDPMHGYLPCRRSR